jgi:hypothetical protein
VLGDRLFAQALSYTLSLAVARLVAVAIMPLLLAIIVARFGRGVRLTVRLLFTLPLAMYAPAAIAVIWTLLFRSARGLPFASGLGSRDGARQTLLLLDSLYTVGLACGTGLMVFLPALRRTAGQRAPSPKPVVVSWLLGLLATLALTVQSFTMSFVLTGGGPAGATSSLTLYQYQLAFQSMRFGAGAVVAVVTLLTLAVLGLGAGLMVVFSGLQLEMTPSRPLAAAGGSPPERPGGLAVLGLAVLLIISLALGAAVVLPLLWNLFNSVATPAAYSEFLTRLPAGRILVNTVVPPTLAGVFQVVIAYLAALGIGAVRPLGRWSELLLLPVSPWLFVTMGPLSLAAFQTLRGFNLLGTLPGLIPPLPLSVPMVFVLTLFFRGQTARTRAAQAGGASAPASFLSGLLLPSLPLALLLLAFALMAGFQDLYWPAIAGTTAASRTMATTFLFLRTAAGADSQAMLSAAITLFEMPLSVVFFVVLGAFQMLYLDRLTLTSGR